MGTTAQKPFVLIVDNDKEWNKAEVERWLEKEGCKAVTAPNYGSAVRLAHKIKGRVGVLFTDVILSEERSGIDLLRYFDLYLPNFVCYAVGYEHILKPTLKREAIWAGAEAVLYKPVSFEDLRIFVMRPQAIKRARMAVYDNMTGLMSRGVFTEVATTTLHSARRHKEPLSLLFIDANDLKMVNDTYGHEAGDRVLEIIASAIREHSRTYDHPCRWAGDEFVILLQGANENDAHRRVHDLKKAVEEKVFDVRGGESIKLSISVGVTELFPEDRDIIELVSRADEAMYKDKGSRGR
ncbi:MAG: hypothetical protein A3J09_00745 [Candidatus Zambryskibacteria bacterium RIFCSPLOWO2_02_FULL_51_21]|uniref:GGDEF domain-containing protein n=1 Tax=Candidatus Zambryskibacteria bacterium RIFCSPHIGHO2_02_FULL_43_37 TaxID=1802749 RepID=A0A1G2TJ89_9BACT|nr:MAG: hypothetical protein A2723_00740 [Candidatus Zambryskibacteria bacterium RIFCSPHIGHO2_01_FULL_52_18]OHA96729.1 MAG: hypothetical protein A3D49_02705 [Candidatus Zambryskibacteria bacterium RIFCSPHIGHO2_02_FULL_43_37]OHB07422.1 MAG: hypothetical protein A2944_01780 [Candidatus Zambryskibacteria bacterium RIFCSPLOWO2_01_FULL_52_12]OHB11084.1 MAG: hypothetical protein A3J09_00745 [Candidatus Zambryskibacteria bacterium RIFCSPLOWO2_02_FULL_51_21]